MLPIKKVNRTNDKVTRIVSGFINFENGKVRLPETHPELENFINEYTYFPHGKHEDMLDSMELVLQLTKEPIYNMSPYLIVGNDVYEDDYENHY